MYYRPVDRHLPFTLIRGGEGQERTRFVCGYLGCDARPFNPLLAALPPMLRVSWPTDGGRWVTDLFSMALKEGGSGRAGGETVLAKLSELMFVEVIRCYIETLPLKSRGWLSGLRDPHIGKALRLLHARPAEGWTLDRLAREAGLSRTVFAERFSEYVGVSPLHYLTGWRLQLARRLLQQTGFGVARAAAAVGYKSEAAFNPPLRSSSAFPQGRGAKADCRRPNTSLLIPFEFRLRLARRRRREKFDLRRLRRAASRRDFGVGRNSALQIMQLCDRSPSHTRFWDRGLLRPLDVNSSRPVSAISSHSPQRASDFYDHAMSSLRLLPCPNSTSAAPCR